MPISQITEFWNKIKYLYLVQDKAGLFYFLAHGLQLSQELAADGLKITKNKIITSGKRPSKMAFKAYIC